MNLPKKDLDTMSEAIALSSPSGSMSKRSKDAALKRLGDKLFGDRSCFEIKVKQPTEQEYIQQTIDLYKRIGSKKLLKQAIKLEIKLKELKEATL